MVEMYHRCGDVMRFSCMSASLLHTHAHALLHRVSVPRWAEEILNWISLVRAVGDLPIQSWGLFQKANTAARDFILTEQDRNKQAERSKETEGVRSLTQTLHTFILPLLALRLILNVAKRDGISVIIGYWPCITWKFGYSKSEIKITILTDFLILCSLFQTCVSMLQTRCLSDHQAASDNFCNLLKLTNGGDQVDRS